MHVYLDHNATTPLRSGVFDEMRPWLTGAPAANASSPHRPGQAARYAVERAREHVAGLAGSESAEVVFTSGGTEACNLALLGSLGARAEWRGAHVVSTAIEHPAVEECLRLFETEGGSVTRVAPDPAGDLEAGALAAAVRPETVLVTVMLANNETGALQPVEEIARRVRRPGLLVHTDAVQAAGRIRVDFERLGVDLLSLSAHKMGGPQGAGALIARRGVEIVPAMLGGPQERRRRGGTEPVALLAGFGEAARLALEEMGRWERVTGPLRDRFEAEILDRFPTARLHRAGQRLPNTASVAFPGRIAEALVMALDLEGLAVSTGSACSSGATLPSRVLAAMGLSEDEIRSTIRVSFGTDNTADHVDRILDALHYVLGRAETAHLPEGQRTAGR